MSTQFCQHSNVAEESLKRCAKRILKKYGVDVWTEFKLTTKRVCDQTDVHPGETENGNFSASLLSVTCTWCMSPPAHPPSFVRPNRPTL